jgi:hypothetical protein
VNDPEFLYRWGPLSMGKRHSCVPLRGGVHRMNAFIYNSSGVAKWVRIHKGTTMLAGARPEVDYWHRQSEWNSGPKWLPIAPRREYSIVCQK